MKTKTIFWSVGVLVLVVLVVCKFQNYSRNPTTGKIMTYIQSINFDKEKERYKYY